MSRSWFKVSRIAKDVSQQGQQQSPSDTDTDQFSIPLRESEPGTFRPHKRNRGARKAGTPRIWNDSIGDRTSTPIGSVGTDVQGDFGRRPKSSRPGQHSGFAYDDENRREHPSVSPATDERVGNTRECRNTVFDQLAFQSVPSTKKFIGHLQGGHFLRNSSSGNRTTRVVNQLPSEEQRDPSSAPSKFQHVHSSPSQGTPKAVWTQTPDAVRNPLSNAQHLADGDDIYEYVYTIQTLSTILAPSSTGYMHGTTLRSRTTISVREEKTSESTNSDLSNFRKPLPAPPQVIRPRYEVNHSLLLHVYTKPQDGIPKLHMEVVLFNQTSNHTI